MNQTFSHSHLAHAHHSGIAIGTIVGSCSVTVFIAIAIVTASPRLLLHPLSLRSELTIQANDPNQTKPGTAGSIANSQVLESQRVYGNAVSSVSEFSQR